jgi:hypothetical protein
MHLPSVIFVGWLIGLLFGTVLALATLVALSVPIPVFLGPLSSLIGSSPLLVTLGLIMLVYLAAYTLATLSLAPLLPAVTLPLAGSVISTAPVRLPPAPGERFARGFCLGLTASMNSVFLSRVLGAGALLGAWALVIGSLAMITRVALSRVYQGFLAWTAWLLPVSYPATAVGLLLFVLNAPFALAAGGFAAFRIDWTTGVIESAGGLVGLPIFAGRFLGFSLGNFNFLFTPGHQDSFVESGLSSHETGHTLNTAAFGGVVLWINAIDENILPRRANLAYGELAAESHAQGLPPIAGAPHNYFFITLWG